MAVPKSGARGSDTFFLFNRQSGLPLAADAKNLYQKVCVEEQILISCTLPGEDERCRQKTGTCTYFGKDALQEEAEQDSDSKMRQSQTHQQGLWYSRVLGPLTQMMTSTTNMKFMLADIEKKARKDLTQTTNHEFINQFTQNASNQYYTPGTGWEYAPFNTCEQHLKGDNFVLNKDFNSGLATRCLQSVTKRKS